MAYPLKKLFHMDRAKYEEEYLKRFNSPDAVHFDFKISGEQAFMCQTPEILNTIISIERTDKHVRSLHKDLPLAAINQFANRCLIDEIVLSNNIEGVHSTRRELSAILSDLSKKNKRQRFYGLVNKYKALMTTDNIPLENARMSEKYMMTFFLMRLSRTPQKMCPTERYSARTALACIPPRTRRYTKG